MQLPGGQDLFAAYYLFVILGGQSLIAWEVGRHGIRNLALEGMQNQRIGFAMMLFVSLIIIGRVGGFTFPNPGLKPAIMILVWVLSLAIVSQRLVPAAQRLYDRAKHLHERGVIQYGNYHERGPGASFEEIQGDARLREAEKLYLRAAELAVRGPRSELNLAAVHHQLGFLYRQQGKFEEATRRFSQAIKILRKLEYLQPDRRDVLSSISSNLFFLGEIYHVQGEREKASRKYQESLAIDEKLGDSQGVRDTRRMLDQLDQNKPEPTGEAFES